MRMRSLILYVISCYGVYKCVCVGTMISWCSVKASAAIHNSPRSPRNVTTDAYIHTHTHTLMHIYTHTHTDAYIHTHTH